MISILLLIVLGNLCSIISSVILGLSAYQKDKQHMILYQIFDCVFATLSCILLLGMSGVITNFAALVRNIAEYFKFRSKLLSTVITIGVIVVGVYDCALSKNIICLAPVIAFIEYFIVISTSNNYKLCKISLAVNELLWLIYELAIFNFAGAVVTTIVLVSTVNAIKHTKDTIADNGLNKYQRKQLKFEVDKLKQQS